MIQARIPVVLAAVVCVVGCSTSDSSRDGRANDAHASTADQAVPCDVHLTLHDNEVLAAILTHLTAKPSCFGTAWKEMLLVDTISPGMWTAERQQVAPSMKPLNPPALAVDSFLCRNSRTVKISTPPPATVPCQLIAPSAIGTIETFMAKHPNAGGLVGLSLPGYASQQASSEARVRLSNEGSEAGRSQGVGRVIEPLPRRQASMAFRRPKTGTKSDAEGEVDSWDTYKLQESARSPRERSS